MNLIDRYVHAVGAYLPGAQRRDIVDELAGNLHDAADDRAALLGRPLTQSEEESLLVERGHPMNVAAAYLPQRSLIGPALLPQYLLVLKIVVGVLAGIFLLVLFPIQVFTGTSVGAAALNVVAGLWFAVWIPIGVLTVIFASVERWQLGDVHAGWNPRHLPQVRDHNAISRADSIAQIAFGAVSLVWWLSGAPFPTTGLEGTFPTLTVWDELLHHEFVPVLAIMLGNLLLGIVNLARPFWTPARLGLRALVDLATVAVTIAVLSVRSAAIAADSTIVQNAGSTKLAVVSAGIDLGLVLTLVVIGIVSAITCCLATVRAVNLVAAPRK